MSEEIGVTLAQFDAWVPVQEVIKQVADFVQGWDVAAATILSRLRSELLSAASKPLIAHQRGREVQRYGVAVIGGKIWRALPPAYVGSNSLWRSGDGIISVPNESDIRDSSTEWHIHSLRFDPESLYEWIGEKYLAASIDRLEAHDGDNEETDERRPVAEPDLKAWAELFLRVYPAYTFKTAWNSAKGMFPDKRVTRDAVQKLIPSQGRGRPKNK